TKAGRTIHLILVHDFVGTTNGIDKIMIDQSGGPSTEQCTPMLFDRSPGDAHRSVTTIFQNWSHATLIRTDCHLDGGEWSENKYPPEAIPSAYPNQVNLEWASESHGFMTGTEGYVKYTFQDTKTTIKMCWDDPFVGSNKYSVTMEGPLEADYTWNSSPPAKGNNATVHVILLDKSKA
ncbi:MAG: hypothetical protein L6R41_007540, partial [Letrouitia leprolyta]